mmetsp:Transcript_336/g.770  ORF Transcript_336/g.770 Transcript_336/m.770 type:complete len:399 (+) Transcript_336:206-1402(+)
MTCRAYIARVFLVFGSVAAVCSDNDSVFMWSSTGGGWRSMMACIGFANMFGQAQLLPLPSDPSSTSDRQYFDAISTTSGASWFSTQFFYSSNFYAQTMTDPASLIKNWMTAYQDIGKEIEKDDLKCLLPSDLPKHKNSKFEKLLQLCDVTMHYDNQWAAFVTAFLNHTAVTAYQDSVYGQLQANPENRIADMKDNNIKLLLHTTLVPQTRTFNREFLDINEDYVSNLVPNLGPGSDNDITYSGVLPVTFSVDSQMNATNGVFTIGAGYPLQVHQSKTKRLFHEEDWKHYGLYPLDAQDTYIISTDSDAKNLGPLDSNFFCRRSPDHPSCQHFFRRRGRPLTLGSFCICSNDLARKAHVEGQRFRRSRHGYRRSSLVRFRFCQGPRCLFPMAKRALWGP